MFSGRCGFDELSRFLMCLVPVPFLLSVFLRNLAGGYVSMFLFLFSMVMFLWSLWRAFSTQLYYRKRENEHFTSRSFYRSMNGAAERFRQRHTHSFFRCPGCREWLRVPRNAGTISIRCPKCGATFIKKT